MKLILCALLVALVVGVYGRTHQSKSHKSNKKVDSSSGGTNDCDWGSWSMWTASDPNCIQTRNRSCPCFKGCKGEGSSVEIQLSSSSGCTPKCSWTKWSDWSSCKGECGSGESTRTRQCACYPATSSSSSSYSGLYAVGTAANCGTGNAIETEDCEEEICIRPLEYWSAHNTYARADKVHPWPVNEKTMFFCNKQSWIDTMKSSSSGSIPALSKQYITAVLNRESGVNMDDEITDAISEAEDILSGSCNSVSSSQSSRARSLAKVLAAYNDGRSGPEQCSDHAPCCYWSDWTEWSSCEEDCNSRRIRQCHCPGYIPGRDYSYERYVKNMTKKDKFSGLCGSGIPMEEKPCESTTKCCYYKEWSEWSKCDSTCGEGTQYRSQLCHCSGEGSCKYPAPKESRKCSSEPCDGDCKWGDWTDWSECNADNCGGEQTRKKPCTCKNNNNAPAENCEGEAPEESQKCAPCCQWSDWNPWSDCSSVCGGGQKWRKQKCACLKMPHHGMTHGDDLCEGEPELQHESCNDISCIVPRSAAYWKTHYKYDDQKNLDEDAENPSLNPWPLSQYTRFSCTDKTEVPKPGDDTDGYSDNALGQAWIDLIQQPSDDTDVTLAKEYITTRLNYANGAYTDAKVDQVIPLVQDYVYTKLCDDEKPALTTSNSQIKDWTKTLKDYNDRVTTPFKTLEIANQQSVDALADSPDTMADMHGGKTSSIQLTPLQIFFVFIPVIVVFVVVVIVACVMYGHKFFARRESKKISLQNLSELPQQQ